MKNLAELILVHATAVAKYQKTHRTEDQQIVNNTFEKLKAETERIDRAMQIVVENQTALQKQIDDLTEALPKPRKFMSAHPHISCDHLWHTDKSVASNFDHCPDCGQNHAR